MGIPIIQVRGSSAVIYSESLFSSPYRKSNFRVVNMEKNRRRAYCGKMTQGCRKRMVKAISLLVQNLRPTWKFNKETGKTHYHQLSFITLTVANAENLSARTAYHLLFKHFLQWLRRTMDVKTYIWKAELQQRGQIHYHITLPYYIHWELIRNKWNDLQRKAGLLEEYAKKNGHFNPNGTDIKEVREKKKLDYYLTKELAKTIEGKRLHMRGVVCSLIKAGEFRPDQVDSQDKISRIVDEYTGEEITTDGKIWDCSENLTALKLFNAPLTREHEVKIDQWVRNKEIREVKGDFWTMLYFTTHGVDPPDLFNAEEYFNFREHVSQVETFKSNRQRKSEGLIDQPAPVVEVESPYMTWKPFVKEELLLF